MSFPKLQWKLKVTIKYLIVSWHQNDQETNGKSGVGTEVDFFLSHYSFFATKSNSDSGVSHIRLRDTTNPIRYVILSPF